MRLEEFGKGLALAWSPVNQAWFVLWGNGPAAERSVLRVINDKAEARAYVHELLDPPTYMVGQSDEY